MGPLIYPADRKCLQEKALVQKEPIVGFTLGDQRVSAPVQPSLDTVIIGAKPIRQHAIDVDAAPRLGRF